MSQPQLRRDALVLYKNRPARVREAEKKLEIEVEGGETLKVRPKDVMLLHPGPVAQLRSLPMPPGDVVAAWELLLGETTTLADLADLAYGAYTPATAWAAWQLLDDGLYFSGSPESVTVHSPESVAEKEAVREAKAAAERAWTAFLQRLEQGQYTEADLAYLEDVAALALAQRDQSRTLRALGRAETPQNAHTLLLHIGYWDEAVNPYPERLGVPLTMPDLPLPELPDEPRRDLTHLVAWAIDDEGSTDPDDALSWDGERLWVHIADAAALIPPNSPADVEARGRGANLYLPERTIPMLPHAATARLALGLSEVSPALSFALHLSPEGDVTAEEIVPSWVRVSRTSYEAAETHLEQSPFAEMWAFMQPFREKRARTGAIEIDLPEVRVRVKEGEVMVRPLPNLRSRNLVREAMLMTGEAVARYALAHHIPIPFTTQEPPEGEAPPAAATPAENFALRRMMKRGQQKVAAAPHAGLGMPLYVQATSPLRRYLDMVVHQQLRRHLQLQQTPDAAPLLTQADILARIGSADAITGTLRQTERLSNTHWILVYLRRNPDWQGEGVIIEKFGSRDLVLIPDLAYETEMYLRKDTALDDRMVVAVSEVNLPELTAHFRTR